MFEAKAGVVRVFFNQSPATAFGVQGNYTVVRDAHTGITGVERRPDILVTFDPHDRALSPRRIIIEVKKSIDGRYLSDSIYKAFGYLYDFDSLWTTPIAPKIVLIVPESVSPKATNSITEVLIVSAQDRDVLAFGLQQLLGRASG